MRLKLRSAFTLLEVALSIGVLVVGLTAIVSVYMVSLNWAEEIRVDLTALQTARVVLADAGVLTNKDDTNAGCDNPDTEAKGWVNDYFMLRSYDPALTTTLPNDAGDYVQVRVQVYYGGDNTDGQLAHELYCHQIILKAYNP